MNLKIEFNNLNIQTRKYRSKIKHLVDNVIDSNNFFNGPENKKLEKNLHSFLKGGLVSIVASGHDALFLSLSSLGLKSSDEIIFPVNSYPTAFPIALTKARTVPVDVEENGLINPNEIARAITKNTKVIIITHLYGLVCDVDKIKKIIAGKSILLIEDCAQAFGSKYKNKPVGTLGDVGCFSFYPTKNLGTLGDGGAIWTKNKKIFRYITLAKCYGENKKYYSEFVSGHSQMPEIQAGILNIYFKNIKKDLVKRIKQANYYSKMIGKKIKNSHLRMLYDNSSKQPLHLFVVEAKKRDELQKYLRAKGISTLIHYPNPIHLVNSFSSLGYKLGDFPISERLAKNILSLPFHPDLTDRQIDFVVDNINKFYND